MPIVVATATLALRLNESPSEKEGKCACYVSVDG